MKTLYKITKTRYHIPYQETEYRVDRTQVVYNTNKNAPTLAFKYAQSMNEHADLYEQRHPDRKSTYRYDVKVEVCDLPEFTPATYCSKHGVQPMLNVPGLTSELTCVECI